MSKKEVQNLKHGLYEVYWKSGGSSLAAIGSLRCGKRWIAPINWVSDINSNNKLVGYKRRVWRDVKRVVVIRIH